MRSVRVPAFAKINLCLRVLGRRPDGYHELRTIFQAISLHDTLELQLTRGRGIELVVDESALHADATLGAALPMVSGVEPRRPDKLRGRSKQRPSDPTADRAPAFCPADARNLVWQALDALRRELKLKTGVRARLIKRIPVARGLGGGSSDAAAALLGLLKLTGREVPLPRLVGIASRLGADVPFFLFGGRALGVSRGDEIYPLPDGPRRTIVVVSPRDIAVNTREAFRWLSRTLTKSAVNPKLWRFCALCWSPQGDGLRNDFEAPVFQRHPRLRRLKRVLLRRGAAEAALAGSGSAVFGVFTNPAQARRAAQGFPGDLVFVTETLTREDYRRAFVRRQPA